MPLYGEADAGRIWNRTLVRQLVQVQKFHQSEYDPCYFDKVFPDGERIDLCQYVDDGIYAIRAADGIEIPESVDPKDLDELAKYAPQSVAEIR